MRQESGVPENARVAKVAPGAVRGEKSVASCEKWEGVWVWEWEKKPCHYCRSSCL
jgi:hypothetical protein